MWCKSCNRETSQEICELCGQITEEDIPVMIYWCKNCKTPIIREANRIDIEVCPLCNGETSYMSSDLRPVFPEERLLLEALFEEPLAYKEKSVWASNNRYFIDGEVKVLPNSIYKSVDVEKINSILEKINQKMIMRFLISL